MPFPFKALSAALSIIAAAAMTAPVRAQQSPPAPGQEPVPNASPQDGPATRAPTSQPPLRGARAGSAAVIAAVNLRNGPGTDSEIITTIPAGSTVRVASCSGEWCEVTWNGRSGYAIARNLSMGAPRQAGAYGPRPGYPGGPGPGYPGGPRPGYADGYGPEPPAVYEAPGYYAPPAVVYGPAYYGPYYGPGWGWRRRWGW